MASTCRSRSRSPRRCTEMAPIAPELPVRRRSAFVTLATGDYLDSAVLLVTELRRQLDKQESARRTEDCHDDDPGVDILLYADRKCLRVPPGVIVRCLEDLEPLPATVQLGDPIFPHFRFCWRKLLLWTLTQYEVLVYMDADILVMGSALELLNFAVPSKCIAAVPSCQCWCGDECSYTEKVEGPPSSFYFNAGVLILRPSRDEFDAMLVDLHSTTKEYPFAEQDFLNDHFRGRVEPLPPLYNMLKFAFVNDKHRNVIRLDTCVCLHYVMAKPWERASKVEEEFADLHKLWRNRLACHNSTSSRWISWTTFHVDVGQLSGCIYYVPDYLSAEEERQLSNELYGNESEGRWQQLRHRQLQCWGGVPHPDGAICEALPSSLAAAASRLVEIRALGEMPEQCLVNSYKPGEGIDAHMDGPLFLPAAVVLSFEGPALIRFGLVDKQARPDLPKRFELLLQPRSLLLFRGDAYKLYVHSIDHAESDTVTSQCANAGQACVNLGACVARAKRRTSITFRQLRNVKLRAGQAALTEELSKERARQWEWWAEHVREFD